MSVLSVLEWIMISNNIITRVILLIFAFSLLFCALRGKSR